MGILIDSTEEIQEDLKEEYMIQDELSPTAGLLSLKCGWLIALASSVLHTVNHVTVVPMPEPARTACESDLEDVQNTCKDS